MSKAIITDLDRIFGSNVRRYRLERHMTQERLAEAAGISTSHCANIESGRNSVTLETLKRLATVLDVTTEALLEEETEHPSEISAQNIAAIVKHLSPEMAMRVERILHFLIDEGILK